MKHKLIKAHVLKLPEFEKPFKVQTGALDYAIGGVNYRKGNIDIL